MRAPDARNLDACFRQDGCWQRLVTCMFQPNMLNAQLTRLLVWHSKHMKQPHQYRSGSALWLPPDPEYQPKALPGQQWLHRV